MRRVVWAGAQLARTAGRPTVYRRASVGDYEYVWWGNDAKAEMAAVITRVGLRNCPVCESESSLGLLPWPTMVGIGGDAWKPQGEPHRGNILFIAVVRCESCGHVMLFDSEKLTGRDEPSVWPGPGPPRSVPVPRAHHKDDPPREGRRGRARAAARAAARRGPP